MRRRLPKTVLWRRNADKREREHSGCNFLHGGHRQAELRLESMPLCDQVCGLGR
jgi:hypothetical protein